MIFVASGMCWTKICFKKAMSYFVFFTTISGNFTFVARSHETKTHYLCFYLFLISDRNMPRAIYILPPLGKDSLKSPSVASQVLPSPPHTRHRSSLASELRMLSQPTCFKIKSENESERSFN